MVGVGKKEKKGGDGFVRLEHERGKSSTAVEEVYFELDFGSAERMCREWEGDGGGGRKGEGE